MKRYFLLWILAAGTLFLWGCQKNDMQSAPGGNGDLSYDSRVRMLVSLSVGDMQVETSPMDAKSGARAGATVASDLWYAVFDAFSGDIVPAADGRMVRHLVLVNGVIPDLEEVLPTGRYTLSFLSMSEGGDLSAVQHIGKLTDPWLKASADGRVAGDFYFGQATLDVQLEQTNTVNVELKHVAGLFFLKLTLANTSQENAIRAIDFSVTDGTVCGTLSAGGSYANPTPVSGVDMTGSRGLYLLLPSTETGAKYTGSVTLTLVGSDGKEYQRSYPFDLMLRAGQRTTFDLRLDLAYDALDVLTQGNVTQEARMFTDAEPVSVMQNEERRSFYAKEPLRVVKKDNQHAYVQFYSLQGIGRTEIYARVKSGGEYFKVYELDTIKPLAEITLPLRLLQGKVITSVREDGRLVKVPTAGLAWDHFEFRCVNTTSAYWQRYGNGTAKVNFKFRIFGPAQLPPNNDPTYIDRNFMDVTPSVARKMVVLALNWGYMFSTDGFKARLDVGGPYHIGDSLTAANYIHSSPEDMYRRVMELDICTMMLQKPGAGVSGQALLKVKMIAVPEEQYTAQIPTDNLGAGSLFVKHHEFAHILGFPDNYGAPSGSVNTITPVGSIGWPKVCDETVKALAEDGDLPVRSIRVLDTIFN